MDAFGAKMELMMGMGTSATQEPVQSPCPSFTLPPSTCHQTTSHADNVFPWAWSKDRKLGSAVAQMTQKKPEVEVGVVRALRINWIILEKMKN